MRLRNASTGRAGFPRQKRVAKLTAPVLAAALLSLASSCGGGGGQQQGQQGGATTQQQGGGGTTAAQGGSSTAMQGGTTAAQGGTTMQGATTMGGTTMGQGGTPVSAIIANPRRYYGQKATVGGAVAQPVEPRAFVMLDKAELKGGAIDEVTLADKGVLVIGRSGTKVPDLAEDHEVRVRGTLQRFNIASVERQLRVNLDDKLYAEYQDRPVILASRVTPAPGGTTQMGGTTGQ